MKSAGDVGAGATAVSKKSERYEFGAVGFFLLLHAGVMAAFFVPFQTSLLWWFAGSYLFRMFGVTAGYHRYFSHHFYQSSCRQGLRWWEIDVTYYVLRGFALLGLARGLRPFPGPVLMKGRSR